MSASITPTRVDIRNCQYKEHFPSHAAASQRAKRIRKHSLGHRIKPYQCLVCGGWLLAHTRDTLAPQAKKSTHETELVYE